MEGLKAPQTAWIDGYVTYEHLLDIGEFAVAPPSPVNGQPRSACWPFTW